MTFIYAHNLTDIIAISGVDLGGDGRGGAPTHPPPLEMTCGFLIQLVFCQKKLCGLLVLK